MGLQGLRAALEEIEICLDGLYRNTYRSFRRAGHVYRLGSSKVLDLGLRHSSRGFLWATWSKELPFRKVRDRERKVVRIDN